MFFYWRFVFAWMGFSGLVLVYMLRVNLSVAIVAMVNSTVFKPKNFTPECPTSVNESQNIVQSNGEFMWSEKDQTMLLSSFYWGYTIMQLPSGILLLFFKAKWIYGLSTLTTSFLTFLMPVAADYGIYPLVALRFLMGICEGPTFPSLYQLCGCWILSRESSIVVTCITAGGSIGTILGQSLSGFLIHYYGWRSLFYIMGSFGCVWFVVYGFVVYDRPSDHPFISDYEKQILIETLPHNQPDYKPKQAKIPWKKVMTSGPFIGFLIFGTTYNFVWYTMINCLPLYIGTVLGFDIQSNGGISSLPYIALLIFGITASAAQDFLKSKNILSMTKIRKIFACSGMVAASAIMYSIIFVDCNVSVTILLVCASIAFLGFSVSVSSVNLLDIAPAYAGPLVAICNVCNSLVGIIAPYVKGYFTRTGETRDNWQNVFITSSSILFFGAMVFLLFGSATLQPWAVLYQKLSIDESLNTMESKSILTDREKDNKIEERFIQ